MSRRKARYRARIHKSDIARYVFSGWDTEGDITASGMVTIVWFKDDQPGDKPPGMETVGGVWQ